MSEPSTPKDARQQARADKAVRKSQRSWFARHKILTAIGVLVLLGIIGGIASSGSKTNSTATVTPAGTATASSNPPAAPKTAASEQPGAIAHAEDIAITACAPDDLGNATGKVVATNHSSKPSNYLITIAFDSKDGKTQVGTGDAVVNNLGPGQASSPQDANSLTKAPAGGYTCKLAQLTRLSSNG